MSSKYSKEYLSELQGYPLSIKIQLTKQRIREWVHRYGEDGVYVSFSGGKDSTVLLHIVREMYGDSIPAVYVDTGLEYPEIRQFVRETEPNAVWLKPKKNFRKIIEEYGYPFISKEVSECVYMAKKYLTEIADEISLDRQTDRQYHKSYYQFYRKLCGLGEYARHRKFKGNSENTQSRQRQEVNVSNSENVRDAHDRQPVRPGEEYP